MLTRIVDFDSFLKILNRPNGFRDPGEPEEYCRGFQVFDKDMTGFIGVGQLRYILTNLGEKMSDEEVDELLKTVDTSSGEINYTGMFLLFFFAFWGLGRLMCRPREDDSGELSRPRVGTYRYGMAYTYMFTLTRGRRS